MQASLRFAIFSMLVEELNSIRIFTFSSQWVGKNYATQNRIWYFVSLKNDTNTRHLNDFECYIHVMSYVISIN